jgi:ureidoacrylate peracid hydrolase
MEILTTLAEKVDPERAAVLMIDYQNDFCSEGGFLDRLGVDLGEIQASIPRAQELLRRARAAGVPVIHAYYDGNPDFFVGPMIERLGRKHEHGYCLPDTWGIEFVEGLQPEPGELVIGKHRYSAFFGTDLDMRLRGMGRSSVVLGGVASNNCVDGTGRDAYYNGYYVVMSSDASAAPTAELHQATLTTVEHAYGVVATTDEIAAVWEQSAGAPGKPAEAVA